MFPFVLIPVLGMLLMYMFSIFETHELGPPTGLKILGFKASSVHIGWTPRVFDDILNKKVIIKIWNLKLRRDYTVDADRISAWVPFFPNSKNYIAVAFISDTHEGEYSEIIQFKAPDKTEGSASPQNFRARQLGNSSVILSWKRPEMLIGVLKAYIIEYIQTSDSSAHAAAMKSVRCADNVENYKISDLKHGNYQFHLRTENTFGISNRCTVTATLVPHVSSPPDKPDFDWKIIETNEWELDFEEASSSSEIVVIDETKRIRKRVLKVSWLPCLNGNPGNRFFVQFRPKSQGKFVSTHIEERKMYILVDNLKKQKLYEVIVTSQDGEFSADSDIKEVQM